jgi:hypothetical protein
LTTIVIAACGAGVPAGAALTDNPTAAEILDASHAAMAKVRSYRFATNVYSDSTGLTGDTGATNFIMTIDGHWAAPERYRINIGPKANVTFVSVGRRWFYLTERSDVWEEGPPNPLGVPRWRGRSEVPDMDAATLEGVEQVDDRAAYRITGSRSYVASDGGDVKVTYNLRIDKTDLLLLSSVLTTEGVDLRDQGGGATPVSYPLHPS